jgi:hypothetical protein
MTVHVPAQVEDPVAISGGEDASEASARSRLLNEYRKVLTAPVVGPLSCLG